MTCTKLFQKMLPHDLSNAILYLYKVFTCDWNWLIQFKNGLSWQILRASLSRIIWLMGHYLYWCIFIVILLTNCIVKWFQEILTTWCQIRYLDKEENNYALGVRAIHEFECYFRQNMPDIINECYLCRLIVFRVRT